MTIGIVNDLPIAVETLQRALVLRPNHRIIWVAQNGEEAVERCRLETPDLVLMDMLMPTMDGIEATRRIMANTPCAILIVTVGVGSDRARVFEAMGHGALDAVDTPATVTGDLRASVTPLLSKIDLIARLIGEDTPGRSAAERRHPTLPSLRKNLLLAIGSSAGGPAALAAVLGGLPRDFPAAVVVIQHVDEQFAAGMATWLGQHSNLPVRVARAGDALAIGTALLAATGDHLVLRADRRLDYTPDPRDYVYRPSVDVFFRSVSQFWPGEVIGVLLTGMGRDGATGLKALRDKGHYTIAQDQATSAVYGMSKAAAALDAAVDILPLNQIAPKLIAALVAG